MNSLKIVWVDPKTLVLDPENARHHPARNIDSLKSSLERFGQQKPIVVAKDDVVIAGNGLLTAALDLGIKKIGIVRTGLSPGDARAFAIADNRIAELAEWDWETLASQIAEVGEADFEAMGWADYEVELLKQGHWEPDPPSQDTEGDIGDDFQGQIRIPVTREQYEVFIRGAAKAREQADGDETTMSDGRCLELICGDFLA